jgi:serine phosphatase RsbU (regulator of sigma subunit)
MTQRPSDPQVAFGPQAVRPAEVVAGDVLSWLLDQSHELAPADLADALDRAFVQVGAVSSRLFLSDHDQMSLNPLVADADGDGAATSFRIDGTVAGRAFALETTCVVPVGDGVRLWVPVLNGTARLGVVAVDFPTAPDAALIRRVETVAALAAQLIETKDSYTDLIELGRRGREMSLAAELQRRNLPPVALVTPYAVVSGILEPAYDVAGDTFDYALNADALHVAVIDSVGHDLGSSVISHLVHGSLRNSRRNGHDLPDTYARADQAVTSVFRELTFATAAFGRLDLASGAFRWVSAGHPPPLVVRGRKVVNEAVTVPSLPIGLGGPPATVNEVALDPGDMVLLYTDGVVEGGARGSERFGLARLIDLLARNLLAELPPAETLRRLARAVLDHSAHELRDDLTMVLVEYRGPPG